LLESVNLLAVILDEYGRVTFCNDCVLRTTNWRREEVLGGNWFDFFLPVEDRLREQQGFLDTLASGAPKPGFENVIMTRDGERRYVAWDSTLLRSPEGAVVGLAAVGRDITEQRTLEEQYRQAQKMEAVGLLAGGVAHDFNNLLSVIIGYSDILSMRLQPGDLTYEEIQEIRLAGGRARDLTRQLLAFSRKQVLEVRLLDVNHIIAGWEKLLRRLIGETIEVRTNTISTGLVKADPTQLELILMNLAVNARDAMPGGGTLSIETEDVTLDAEYTRMHVGVRPGRYVMLAVSDTGFGMDEQTMRRVFEPFFTTKEKGKGTGLGLATVYGIVKQHGGDIWLYSEPGQGTTFKVYLPAVQEEMDGAIPVPNTIHKDYCGSERVLVVEDDPSLRKLVCAILASAGYAVIETQNSLDAVDRAMEDGLIDIMVSDVVMPKMNGQEVYEKVKFLQPQIKVLFMSGYTENIIAEHGIREHTIQILQKPFVAEDLLRKVREVLDY
jgi:PAS domain S-box-containing protein